MYIGKDKRNDKHMLTRGLKYASIKKTNVYLAFLKDRSESTENPYKCTKTRYNKTLTSRKEEILLEENRRLQKLTQETFGQFLKNITYKRESETKYLNEFRVGENREKERNI